jgi:hypothetical protein
MPSQFGDLDESSSVLSPESGVITTTSHDALVIAKEQRMGHAGVTQDFESASSHGIPDYDLSFVGRREHPIARLTERYVEDLRSWMNNLQQGGSGRPIP